MEFTKTNIIYYVVFDGTLHDVVDSFDTSYPYHERIAKFYDIESAIDYAMELDRAV